MRHTSGASVPESFRLFGLPHQRGALPIPGQIEFIDGFGGSLCGLCRPLRGSRGKEIRDIGGAHRDHRDLLHL